MKTKPNPRTGGSGYTLIELMIVVVIIALLSSIALPAYTQFTVRAKLMDALAATEPIKLALVDYAIANGGTSGCCNRRSTQYNNGV